MSSATNLARIADDGSVVGHVVEHNCPHAYGDIFSYRHALPNEGASAYICAVADRDVAIAIHAGGEGDEITDHAFVSNVAVDIGVEVPADTGFCFDDGVVGENGPLPNLGVIRDNRSRGSQGEKPCQAFGYTTPRGSARDGDAKICIFGGILMDRESAQFGATIIAHKTNLAAIFAKSVDGVEHLQSEAACTVNGQFSHAKVMAGSDTQSKRA